MNTYLYLQINFLRNIELCTIIDLDNKIEYYSDDIIGKNHIKLEDHLILKIKECISDSLTDYDYIRRWGHIYIQLSNKNQINKILKTETKNIMNQNFKKILLEFELEEYLI